MTGGRSYGGLLSVNPVHDAWAENFADPLHVAALHDLIGREALRGTGLHLTPAPLSLRP